MPNAEGHIRGISVSKVWPGHRDYLPRSKSGVFITEEIADELAEEAERGYDLSCDCIKSPPCYCADELEDCGGEYVCECADADRAREAQEARRQHNDRMLEKSRQLAKDHPDCDIVIPVYKGKPPGLSQADIRKTEDQPGCACSDESGGACCGGAGASCSGEALPRESASWL